MLSDLIQYFTNNSYVSNLSNNSSKNINNSNKKNTYHSLIDNKLDPIPKLLDFVHKNTLNQKIRTAIEIGIDRNRDLILDYASFGFDNYYSLNYHYCDTFEMSDDTNFLLQSLFSTFDKDVKIFHGSFTIDTFIEVDENKQEYELNEQRKCVVLRKSEIYYIFCPISSKILFNNYDIILRRSNVKNICLKYDKKVNIL